MQETASPQPTNLIDVSTLEAGKVWWKGSAISGYSNYCVTPMIPVIPGETYWLYRYGASQNYCSYLDENGTYVTQERWTSASVNPSGETKQIPSGVYYIGISIEIARKDESIFMHV